jgi:hypothetical protein
VLNGLGSRGKCANLVLTTWRWDIFRTLRKQGDRLKPGCCCAGHGWGSIHLRMLLRAAIGVPLAWSRDEWLMRHSEQDAERKPDKRCENQPAKHGRNYRTAES